MFYYGVFIYWGFVLVSGILPFCEENNNPHFEIKLVWMLKGKVGLGFDFKPVQFSTINYVY